MALWPPGLPFPFAPPPPRWLLSPPPPRPWRPPPLTPSSRGHDNTSSPGGVIAGVVIGLVASLLAFAIMCALCQGHRNSHASAGTAAAARLRTPQQMRGDGGGTDDGDERQLRRSSDSSSAPTWPDSISSATSPTAGLPAFTYSPSVKRNVSGDGEEAEAAAATCSVCLGSFQIGETVRLLPACLHLYHAECIDPWLDAHTTCPLCRSDTDRRSSALGDVPWHAIV